METPPKPIESSKELESQVLDHNNWTLCVGSLYPDGRIPDVHWRVDQKLQVGGSMVSYKTVNLRARQVVSL